MSLRHIFSKMPDTVVPVGSNVYLAPNFQAYSFAVPTTDVPAGVPCPASPVRFVFRCISCEAISFRPNPCHSAEKPYPSPKDPSLQGPAFPPAQAFSPMAYPMLSSNRFWPGDYNSIMGNTGGDNRTEFDARFPHAVWYEPPDVMGLRPNAIWSPGPNRFDEQIGYRIRGDA